MSRLGISKLDTIKSRAGSVKKTVFLSQSMTGKRFDYMDAEKSKTIPLEITGKLINHDYSRILPTHSNSSKNSMFRNIKLKEFPSSKRTLDFSLQPQSELKTRNKSPINGRSRKNSNESGMQSARTLNTMLNKEDSIHPTGRKHTAIMYKSFTFDSLNRLPDKNNRSVSASRPMKRYIKPEITKEQPKVYHPQKKMIGDVNAATWKNGYWDIKEQPIIRFSNQNHINSTTKELPVNKYVPISLRKDKQSYGRSNYTTTLHTGLVASSQKAKAIINMANLNDYRGIGVRR